MEVVAGRYRLIDVLGRGGMGAVWRARDEVLGREVAVKELRAPQGVSAADWRVLTERSLREARSTAMLRHPAVITVHDVVTHDGRPWIVMELFPGRSLADELRNSGPLPPVRVAGIARDLLGALGAAHRAGVVHRDVKPGNVLIGRDGHAVLTDFGIATITTDPGLTKTGVLIGTPAYMSPEQSLGGYVEPSSDLWSLGATLHAALTGGPPPRGTANPTGPLAPLISGLLRIAPIDRLSLPEAERILETISTSALGQRRDQPTPIPVPYPVTLPLAPPPGTGPGTGRRRVWAFAAGAGGVVLVAVAVTAVLLATRGGGTPVAQTSTPPPTPTASATLSAAPAPLTTWTPPPSPQTWPLITPIPATQTTGLASPASDTPTGIEFVNQRHEQVSVYWVDYSGQKVFYFSLQAGEQETQPTYVGDPWIVTTSATGTILAGFKSAYQPSRAVIT